MSTADADIEEKLARLREEHRDLDDAITVMSNDPTTDQLKLTRMKKRKLRLKDQIAYWESRLIPDLGA
ncbi:MAG: YdcH family protein [Wenzhouxiangella sp.]